MVLNERGVERLDPVPVPGGLSARIPKAFSCIISYDQGVLQILLPGGDSAFVHFRPSSIPLLHRFILPLFFQLQTALRRKYLYILAGRVARSQRANLTADPLNRHAMDGFLRKTGAK